MLELLRLPASKFSPRPLGPNSLERGRLIELLKKNEHAKLVLVHAPAGYGKSTLMSQWHAHLRELGRGVGWIVLDEDDNDSARLAAALGQALMPGSQGAADLFDSLNDCLQQHPQFTLFIDDEERLTDPEAQGLVEVILRLSPPGFHLVIGSRAQPQRLMPRWRVRSDYLEITARELAFQPDEIARYMQQRCQVSIDAETERYLAQRSQGWPAALQLAAAEIRRGMPVRKLFEQGAAASTNLFQYLSDEVMIQLRPEQHAFLLQTGFIDELSGPLCDAVTQRPDSAALLQELHVSNLPLQVIDSAALTFRYHPLFAEFLLRQLRQRHPGLLPTLARRASDWCARSGKPEAAVEYALLAEDTPHLLACQRACLEQLLLRGQIVTARRWLGAVEPAALLADPDLLRWRVWVDVYSNDFSAAQGALADFERVADGSRASERLILRILIAMVYGKMESVAGAVAEASRIVTREDVRMWAMLANTRSMLYQMQGRFSEAAQEIEEVMARAPPGNWLSYVHACYAGAMLELALGNVQRAWRRAELPDRRIQEAVRHGEWSGNRNQLLALVGGARALVLYELNRLEDAEDSLDRSAPFMNSAYSPSGHALWHLMRGRILAQREDGDAYEDAMQEASAYAARHGIDWMTNMVLWERIDHDVSRGELHRARAVGGALLAKLSLDAPPAWIWPWEDRFGSILSALRLMIYTGDARQALRVLPVHIRHAEQQLRRLRLVRLRVLEALALRASNDPVGAREALRQAVGVGQPTGATRVFVDEGAAVRDLLRELQQDGPLPPEQAAFIEQLRGTFEETEIPGEAGGEPEAPSDAQFPIPLSTRELQILKRLAEGHSNLAVGQQLFLSPNTVKWHLSQIYAKLGVKNRTQAVHVARQHHWDDRG